MRSLPRRLYYALCSAVLVYYCAFYSYGLFMATLTRSIGFTLDTLYLDWNTSFPAVTVCEIFNSEKIWELSESFNGADRDTSFDDLLSDVAFFNGNCNACHLCVDEEADGIAQCLTNFTDIVDKYRTKCSAMLFNCTWNGVELECCQMFLPLVTEFGVCFAINSMHTKPPFGRMPLIANRQLGPGRLRFTALEDITIHLHAVHDVPYTVDGDIKETVLYGSTKEIVVSLIEMTNDEAVRTVAQQRRRCRFTWEQADGGVDSLYAHYSHSTCAVECSRRAQLGLCNCTHHLMPRHPADRNATCDLDGLLCLTENFNMLVDERRQCECLPSCEEPEFNSIYSSTERYHDEDGSLVTISMIDLPKQRHKRTLAKSNLDLMISIGGLCGLFFGLSLISLIELLFHVALRISYGLANGLRTLFALK